MKTLTTLLPIVAITVAAQAIFCSPAPLAAPQATKTAAKKQPAKKKTQKKRPVKAETVPMCPKCNMQMVRTSSLLKRTPIKVNGRTYYCCTICPKH